MNVISYEKAYCLYPRATVHEHRTLVCGLNPSPNRPEALRKYLLRGFKIVRRINPNTCDDIIDRSFPVGPRYIGDSQCWTLTLNMEGVDSGCTISGMTLPHDPVSISNWSLAIRRPPYYDIEMDCAVLNMTCFHFRYVYYSVPVLRMAHEMANERYRDKTSGVPLV